MVKFEFNNKNVIVTGASSGLGKCIAEEFAKAGANVVVADINKEGAEKVSNELKTYNVKSLAHVLDITKYEDVESMMERTVSELGSIDILINCAGICVAMPIIDMEVATADAIVDIDLKGTIYGCKAALKYMKEQKYGKIVNMSSVAAKVCNPNSAVYTAVKAGVISLTTALAREFAQDNININCILPGIIRTSMWEGMLEEMAGDNEEKKAEVFASYTKDIPMGRPQEPIDIANMTLYLCTDEANNMTGQNVGVDGGQTF